MDELERGAEEGGFAHDVVDRTRLEALLYPFKTLKPNKQHGASAIGKGGFQSGGTP